MTARHPAAADLDYVAAIREQSTALAEAAEGNLGAPVQHCPGWSVADLVDHVRNVHWMWGTIAAEKLQGEPSEGRPQRPPEAELIDTFRAGAERVVDVLGSANQSEHVWTWAPGHQNIAFITRHQVQEAAVHRWDAENAAGHPVALSAPLAVDSIEEFLTVSLASSDWPAAPGTPELGRLAVQATDVDASWTVFDGAQQGTLKFERGVADPDAYVRGTASDLLLWLYHRVDADASDPDVVSRFRALSYSD